MDEELESLRLMDVMLNGRTLTKPVLLKTEEGTLVATFAVVLVNMANMVACRLLKERRW